MEDWGFEETRVDSDGSCFFESIAIVLNDSVEQWSADDGLAELMEHHWRRFNRLCPSARRHGSGITQRFVRYMSASAMDEVGLTMHNQEAITLGAETFETPEALARHVLHSECWADQSMLRSFLRSTSYEISVVVFDHATGKPIFAPGEWTFDKKFYVCLRLKLNHYTPLRLNFRGTRLDALVSRAEIRSLMSAVSADHGHDFRRMY